MKRSIISGTAGPAAALLIAVCSLCFSACSKQTDSHAKGEKEENEASAEQIADDSRALPELADESVNLQELQRLARDPEAAGLNRLKRLLTGGAIERHWAAFGLGLHCRSGDTDSIVNALVSAGAHWVSSAAPADAESLSTLGWAIGSCASRKSEIILRSWLSPHPSAPVPGLVDAGAIGLASLADHGITLSERTQTAVLDTASREKRAELLLPLARVGRLSDAVGAHLLEVVGGLLTQDRQKGRREAIFALGSAGPSATAPLSQVLLATSFSAQERAAAAQALARLGVAGQRALDQTLSELLERGLPIEFDRPLWIPLRAALKEIDDPSISKAQLSKLSTVVLSEGEGKSKEAQRRRMIWLRCRAADLVAGENYLSADLQKCDPDRGRLFQEALLRSLGRAPLERERLDEFTKLSQGDDSVIAQKALRLIPRHAELQTAPTLLAHALQSKNPGLRATAAQIIAAYPSRALSRSAEPSESEKKRDDSIVDALKKILEDKGNKEPGETKAAALGAAGALRALRLKPAVEKLCEGPHSYFWQPAAQALALLGSPKQKCPTKRAMPLPQKAAPAFAGTTLVIDSDVGELLLHVDEASAPVGAAHFLSLVDDGFYNGGTIHGSRLGFAIQFGDPDEDGYDNGASPGLPHEVSPRPFAALDFGFGAFAPGAHHSQLFVLVADAPQLTGGRVRLGRGEGPFEELVIGDIFHSIKRQ